MPSPPHGFDLPRLCRFRFINRAIAPARVTIAVIPVLIMLNLETNALGQEFSRGGGVLGAETRPRPKTEGSEGGRMGK